MLSNRLIRLSRVGMSVAHDRANEQFRAMFRKSIQWLQNQFCANAKTESEGTLWSQQTVKMECILVRSHKPFFYLI